MRVSRDDRRWRRPVEVKLSSSRSNPWDGVLKLYIALGLLAVGILPGLLVPVYFRWLTTAIFCLLALVVLRGYLTVFASFKRRTPPPVKADDVEWPSVSVLVVAYNEGTVLPRSMAAMEKVDYPRDRIEFVYVYEKRSTDETALVIQSYAARDARFVALERDDKRGGKAAACNFGLERCTGEILVSLDADQALAPDAVKRAMRWFLSDPTIGCVKGRPLAINGHESILALAAKLERDVIEKGDLYARDVIGGFTFFGGGQAFFRRRLFDEIGHFDEEILIEDIDYSIKIHQAGHRLVVDPTIHSYEEHPAAFRAWWAQRKRWARGWMQITRRYLPRIFTDMRGVSIVGKADLLQTLAYVIIPLAFTVMLPLTLVKIAGYDTRTFVPGESIGWTVFGLTPFVAWIAIWIQDRRDGVQHAWREVVALAAFGFYLSILAVANWSAFIDEFILNRPSVYVKTSKTGAHLPHAGPAAIVASTAQDA